MLLRCLVISACLFLQGCQSSRDRPRLIPVKMSIGRGLGFLPVYLSHQLGLYKKYGLVVSLEDAASSTTKTTQALLGGSADVAGGIFEQTLSTALQGHTITSFVTLMDGDFRALIVAPAKSNRIRRIEDLKGTVVGVSSLGSPNQFLLTSIATRHGVPQKSISIAAVGSFTLAVAALERNKVDAAVLSGSGISLLQKRHPEARLLVDARTAEGMREAFGVDRYPTTVLYSSATWLAANKDTARRVAQATLEGLRWIQQHSPEEIARHLPEAVRTEPEADREGVRGLQANFSRDGVMSIEQASAVKRAFIALPENTGVRNVDASKTFTNEFVAKQAEQ